MAPPPTEDFSKCVGDLLNNEGFGDGKSIKSKSKTTGVMGSMFATDLTVKDKKGDLKGAIKIAKFKHAPTGLTLDKLALSNLTGGIADFNVSTDKIGVPGASLAVETSGDFKTNKCKLSYETDALYAGLELGAESVSYKSATVDATMASGPIQVGGAVSLKGGDMDDVWMGIGYTTKQYFASLSTASMMKKFSIDAMAKPTPSLTVACHAETEKGTTDFAAVGKYKVLGMPGNLTLKSKYAMVPKTLQCQAAYDVLPKCNVQGNLNVKLGGVLAPTYGLAITLG